MLQKFSHAAHGDLKLGKRIKRLEAIAKRKTIFRLFAGAQLNTVAETSARFKMISSKLHEEIADKAVSKKGLAQHFINATAKLTMLTYYTDMLPERNIFEDDTAPAVFSAIFFDEFLKGYEKHGEIWREMCRTELPARFGTHPSCSERMKNLGISDFTIDFNNASAAIIKESYSAYEHADKLLNYDIKDWPLAHEKNYLSLCTLTKKYENGEEISLKEVSDAYFGLCRYDECLNILEKLLEKNSHDPYALFKKGTILTHTFYS